MADGAEPLWFAQMRAATTSWTRFRILGLAAEGRVSPTVVARALNCDPKSATQHLSGLSDQGLLTVGLRGTFEATAAGRAVHERLLAVGERPGALLNGRRLLAIRYDEGADRRKVRRTLQGEAEFVLRADGDVDLVGIFRDDADVVADLERAVRKAISFSVRARIVN